MTEEDKERIRKEKIEVSQRLREIKVSRYRLRDVDQRIETYICEVANNPDAHNLYEQLAVERYLKMCDKYGVDVGAVRKFFTLYESLYFPGKKGPQRYELTPIQAFQFASIYGFVDVDGNRIVKEAVLFVPRKFSKTTSCAAVAVYDLLFGDANAESYTGANSQDQAKKCFDVIRGCMRRLDPNGDRYTVNEQVIKSRRADRSAFAQCLTANARTKDGLNASTVIMDEFSQARDNSLLTVLTTSMGIRKNPLTVIITTASDVFDGPFYEMLKGYKSVLLGDMEDDSLFAHIFQPDVDDKEDSEDTWRKVHPHMGVTVSMDFYRREYLNALRNGADAMLAFRTKLLNLYTENQQRPWVSATLVRQASKPMPLDAIKGYPEAMVAIDLSVADDFSAVTMGVYNNESYTFSFSTSYFFPEGALPSHPNEKLYRRWSEQGYLILTPGDVIDYRTIVEHILKLNTKVEIVGIGYDSYKSHEIVNMLAASGASSVLTAVRQTYGTFTAPCESFEYGIKTGKIFLNDNPINAFCFGNAVLMEDRLGNTKPDKISRYRKIDGVITTLMCMRLFMDYER